MGIIKHIGTKRHSGRYPWGSGGNSQQRNKDFLGYIKELQKEGLSEVEIAEGLGMTTSSLRIKKSLVKAEERAAAVAQAIRLKNKGMSNIAIGERMGLNESSVRALLDPAIQARADISVSTAKMLRETVEKKGYIDVGIGVESSIGISRTKLDAALNILKEEGYKVYYVKTEQVGTGKITKFKVLAPPGTPYSELYKNRDKIGLITDHSYDGGRTYLGLDPIQSVNSNRIKIRYAEEGGASKDGVIELRRGVDDLSLGNSRYAQVRIGVNGTHFLKGMAMYSDNMPPGKDIIYNTNKKSDVPPEEVFKKMKDDPDNPFGAVIKRGGQKKAINIVNEEGDWGEWSRTLSSQVLSKQSPALAKKQLDMALALKQEEYDEINSITNPVVKKRLLKAFYDSADSASVHLKAAALPRQSSHVILPLPNIKENEIYAPNYLNGERVVLVRHPHGGIFEIPELTVNNKNKEAISVMKNAIDAVGIHPKVASKLSGADFDGDTVLVIPNKDRYIKTAPSLTNLKDFDPKEHYGPYDGMITVDKGIYNAATRSVDYQGRLPKTAPKQMKMGQVSNLITDMTIKGASADEIARAVRHSMVVIDSEKHHLNFEQSYIDNGIAALKKKYQGGERSGASTLISRASSEIRVPKRSDRYDINPKTGEKIYYNVDDKYGTYINRQGKIVRKQTVSTKMQEAKDAHSLSSGTKMESVYADYANQLKALANKARKNYIETPNLVYSPASRKMYEKEVESLQSKLRLVTLRKPHERQAQLLANKIISMKRAANPNMTKESLKKIKGQALDESRNRMGANKFKLTITDKEWEAIQLGAVSNNVLSNIILSMDLKDLKIRAIPRTAYKMTPSKVARAKAMIAAGYTQSDIAEALGVSTTTVKEVLSSL